jgi:hypothetical protein
MMANRNGNVMIVYSAAIDKYETIRNEEQNRLNGTVSQNAEFFILADLVK